MAYRSLTIDHTQCGSSDTLNFPFSFSGTFAYLATVANGGEVTSASGYDIVFCTNPANPLGTKLNFERVAWSATSGAVEFWVNIPTLSHTVDTVIYLYYGDNTITADQQNVNATWRASYVLVAHFGSGAAVVLTDSTSNGNNGTNHSATAGASLLGSGVGGAIQFASASSEYCDFGNAASISLTSNFTIQAIVNNANNLQGVISKYDGSNGFAITSHGAFVPQKTLYFQAFNASTETDCFGQGNDWNAGTNSAVATYDGANMKFYAFGLLRNTTPGASLGGATTADLKLGVLNASLFFDGIIDEFRVSNGVISADQILAEYNNTMAGSTFTTIGSEHGPGSGNALVNQSAIELVIFAFSDILINQSAIELIISPGPPPAPPKPGQQVAIVGGLPYAVTLGNCKPKNKYDECLLRIEDLWRSAKIPSRFAPCIGLDTATVPWEFDYSALPPRSESFHRTGSILTPSTAAGDTVVISLSVPNGYDGLLSGIFQIYSGNTLLQGSGDILWRIKANLRYLKNLGSVPYTLGSPKLPAPLTEGEILLSDQVVRYVVNVPNVSGTIEVGNSLITCGLFGFFWPRGASYDIFPKGKLRNNGHKDAASRAWRQYAGGQQ